MLYIPFLNFPKNYKRYDLKRMGWFFHEGRSVPPWFSFLIWANFYSIFTIFEAKRGDAKDRSDSPRFGSFINLFESIVKSLNIPLSHTNTNFYCNRKISIAQVKSKLRAVRTERPNAHHSIKITTNKQHTNRG